MTFSQIIPPCFLLPTRLWGGTRESRAHEHRRLASKTEVMGLHHPVEDFVPPAVPIPSVAPGCCRFSFTLFFFFFFQINLPTTQRLAAL